MAHFIVFIGILGNITSLMRFLSPVLNQQLYMAGILNIGFLAAAILITRLILEDEARIDSIGYLCAGLNIITCGSPLAAMSRVVTTKSVEYMSFFLSFSICINGAIWSIYAILVRNYFIGVPNETCFVLGVAQLVLHSLYENANPSKCEVFVSEEQLKYETLIPSSDQEADRNNQVPK